MKNSLLVLTLIISMNSFAGENYVTYSDCPIEADEVLSMKSGIYIDHAMGFISKSQSETLHLAIKGAGEVMSSSIEEGCGKIKSSLGHISNVRDSF